MYNDTHANRKRPSQRAAGDIRPCHTLPSNSFRDWSNHRENMWRRQYIRVRGILNLKSGLNISYVQYENKYLAIKWFSDDSLNNKSACWVALFCYLQYASVHWNVFRHRRGWKWYMLAWSTCMLWWLWSVRLYFTIWSMCLRLWIRLRYYQKL